MFNRFFKSPISIKKVLRDSYELYNLAMATWILWDCLNKPEAERFNSEQILSLSVHLYESLIRKLTSIYAQCSSRDADCVYNVYKSYIAAASFGLNGGRFLQILTSDGLNLFGRSSSSMSISMNMIEVMNIAINLSYRFSTQQVGDDLLDKAIASFSPEDKPTIIDFGHSRFQ